MKAKEVPTIVELKHQQERELEEERKKKKWEAENYFLAALDDRRKDALEAEANKELSRNISDFLKYFTPDQKKQLPIIYKECSAMVERADIVKAVREEFFSIKDLPQKEEIKQDLESIGLEEKDFSAVALCASEGFMVKLQKHFSNIYKKIKGKAVSKEELSEKELAEVKSSSVEKARLAISGAAKGDPKKLAQILKSGLENCCKQFADSRLSNAKAMEWSENAAEIMYMLDRNEALKSAARLTDAQLECAKCTAEMGMQIRSGLQAIELMSQVQQQGKEIGMQQQDNLLEKVVQMQAITFDRSQFIKLWDEPKIAAQQIQNTMR